MFQEKQYKKVKLFKWGNLNVQSNKIKNVDLSDIDVYSEDEEINLQPHQLTTLYYMNRLENSNYDIHIYYKKDILKNYKQKLVF